MSTIYVFSTSVSWKNVVQRLKATRPDIGFEEPNDRVHKEGHHLLVWNGNYLHAYESTTHRDVAFERFGANSVDEIVDALETITGVPLIDEHDEAFADISPHRLAKLGIMTLEF